MKPDWIIHYILCDRPSSHTHGLDKYGSLELELNLPVSQKDAGMILNLMGNEIARKEGIESWGDLIYRKDESLEEYLLQEGLSEQFKYPFSTFAYLDGNDWVGRGKMCWFGISYNKEDTHAWNQKLEDFISELPDETLLVSVDCHI